LPCWYRAVMLVALQAVGVAACINVIVLVPCVVQVAPAILTEVPTGLKQSEAGDAGEEDNASSYRCWLAADGDDDVAVVVRWHRHSNAGGAPRVGVPAVPLKVPAGALGSAEVCARDGHGCTDDPELIELVMLELDCYCEAQAMLICPDSDTTLPVVAQQHGAAMFVAPKLSVWRRYR